MSDAEHAGEEPDPQRVDKICRRSICRRTSLTAASAAVLAAYAAAMTGVCLLACVVPTRRALSVEPTEALRAEA